MIPISPPVRVETPTHPGPIVTEPIEIEPSGRTPLDMSDARVVHATLRAHTDRLRACGNGFTGKLEVQARIVASGHVEATATAT